MEYDGAAPQGTAPTQASGGSAEDSGGEPPRIPDPDEDNTFVDPGTSGFVPTADDPRSTFGLDVDAGSFHLARSSLSQGYPVPPASVRPEEWVNALSYDETLEPTSGGDLSLVGESGLAPSLDDGTQVVRVGVAAREVPADARPRVNITLVVDRSGSMDIRERLGLVQSSLAVLANQLRDDDTVSVVSFEDQATPLLEPTPVRETRKILRAIERLTPGGSTNLEAGLSLGYEQAREAFDPDAVNLVVLCSDGVANVGSTGPGSITDRIAEEGADGIHLVTVGYGLGNYNDHLMEQLANLGDGFYAYVDTYDEAQQLFGTDLTTTLVPVAGEARAQVDLRPRARLLLPADRLREPRDRRRRLRRPRRRRRRARLRPPRHRPLRGDARRRRRARRRDRVGRGEVALDGDRQRPARSSVDLLAADPEATPSRRLAARGGRRRRRAAAQGHRAVRRAWRRPRRPAGAGGRARGRRGRRRRRARRGAGPGRRGRLTERRLLSSGLTDVTFLSSDEEAPMPDQILNSTVSAGSTAHWRDSKRYLWLIGLVVPSLAFIAFGMWALTGWGVWFWIGPIVILGVVPAIDLVTGLDRSNPPDDAIEALEKDRYYRWITYLFLPIQYVGFVGACYVIAKGAPFGLRRPHRGRQDRPGDLDRLHRRHRHQHRPRARPQA